MRRAGLCPLPLATLAAAGVPLCCPRPPSCGATPPSGTQEGDASQPHPALCPSARESVSSARRGHRQHPRLVLTNALRGRRPLRGCLAPPEPMLAAAVSRGPPCLPAPVASTLFGESLSPCHLSCLAPHPTPRCWRPPSFPHGAPATAPAPAPLPRLAPCSPRQPMRGPLLDPLQGHGD